MSDRIVLNEQETSLLPQARKFAQETGESTGFYPTQEELKAALGCSRIVARNIHRFILREKGIPLSKRRASVRQQVQEELGDEQKVVIKDDTMNIYIPRTDICTEQQLIEYMQIDTEKWQIIECTFNKWSMGTAGGGQQALFQVKARCKLKREVLAVKEEIAALKMEALRNAPPAPPAIIVPATGNLFEVNIPDLHLGKLAWAQETGHAPYDTKIADAIARRAQDVLYERAKGYDFEKILLVLGNDILNSDNAEGTTTQGTRVNTDGRYHKTFYRARHLAESMIEKARTIAPVHVIIMPGNHDRLACWHLGDSLECLYKNYGDVTIDNEPTSRRYFQFGKVMLMFCHGDRGKRPDFPLLMAREKPKMWGETEFRECHTGHYHQTKTEEYHGVRVRILPSLTQPDAWHADNTFVGQIRAAEGYIWNKNEGLIGQVFYNDEAYPLVTTKRSLGGE